MALDSDSGAVDTGSDADSGSDVESQSDAPGTDTVWDTSESGGGDTGTQSDIVVDTGSEETGWDTSTDSQCSGQPDFTDCEIVTVPDRSYDICVGGICVSPGCGDASCNSSGPHFPIPDTNQRQCSHEGAVMTCPNPGQDFSGQDAQYGWDVTHEPGERFTRTDSASLGQPVVQDNVTGLAWQGCEAGLSGSICDTGSSNSYGWTEAVAYCDSLSWSGHADWRLPDSYELFSFVDSGRHNPSVDPGVFPATSAWRFWTLSSSPSDSSSAWEVEFSVGLLGYVHKNNAHHVRCVRLGPFHGRRLEPSVLLGDRVVRDNVNKLEWQGCSAGLSGADCAVGGAGEFTWKEALAYCEGLSLGGSTDWRLPNRIELYSIVDQHSPNPMIDLEIFPATSAGRFWSSTSNVNNPSYAWSLLFNNGYMVGHHKTNAIFVRCVRGGS